MKLIALFGTPTGGNTLDRRDDLDVIGELTLIINSMFDFESFEAARDDQGRISEVAMQMRPLFELNNPGGTCQWDGQNP